MREEVMVLPPSVERRKTGFSLSKKEEALLNTSKEKNKQWAVSDEKNAGKIRGFFLNSRDQQQAIEAESVSTEKMTAESAKGGEECSTEPSKQTGEDDKAYEEGGLAQERIKNLASSSGEGALLLQWGQRKRSRGIRSEKYNLKPCYLIDESSALPRKKMRVQADKGSAARPNTSFLAVKGTLKARNGVIAKTEHLSSFCPAAQLHAEPEEQRKQAKVSKGGPSDARQERKGFPLGGGKRGHPSPLKQEHSLHQSKIRTLPEPKSVSPDRCVTPLTGGNEAKMELVWPKFVISLSRKEKEEDFLMFKGTKLPQRPKRRPKAVERAINYCTSGSWLIDMSQSRYDVREKKRVKKKPRGLKAMESLDSDSDW